MLESIHIHRFRSCSGTVLENLSTITALIGRNGAGKSNVLQAIEWAARVATGRSLGDDAFEDPNGAMTVVFRVDSVRYEYDVRRSTELETSNAGKVTARHTFMESLTRVSTPRVPLLTRDGEQVVLLSEGFVERGVAIRGDASAIPALLSLLPAQDPITAELTAVCRFLRKITYFPLAAPVADPFASYLVDSDELAQWVTMLDRTKASPKRTALKLVDLFLDRKDEFDELLALLGEYGLNVISDVRIREFKLPNKSSDKKETTNFFLHFVPVGTDDVVSFADLSFGTQRLLQLMTAIIYDQASVALVEQPEDGIHPGLLHKLMPLLRDYAQDSQFVFASHAPAVLNRLQPEEVRIVTIDAGNTRVSALTESQLANARLFLEDDGPLSDFIESL